MNLSYYLLMAGLAIGGLNLHSRKTPGTPTRNASIAWPGEFEGQPLHPLPLSEMESSFAAQFPGAIAHFRCGDDQVILRQINRATRKLHRSATCLKAAGFQIASHTTEARGGSDWLTYQATRGNETLHVREQIRATSRPGSTWTDVSQWFWQATIHPDHGPWIAVTVLRSPASSD